MNLILDMRRLGHPSYTGLDEAAVRRRAEALPENGVMPEVLKVAQEATTGMEDKLQPQKAATPCDGKRDLEEAGAVFAAQRPRAVVAEGYANGHREAHEVEVAALADLQEKLTPEGLGSSTFEVRTENHSSGHTTSPRPSPSASSTGRRGRTCATLRRARRGQRRWRRSDGGSAAQRLRRWTRTSGRRPWRAGSRLNSDETGPLPLRCGTISSAPW